VQCPNPARAKLRSVRVRGNVFLLLVQQRGCLHKILFAGDVVAIEHTSGLVSADLHRNCFLHAQPAQIPHSGSAKIMKQESGYSRVLANSGPDFAEALHRPTV